MASYDHECSDDKDFCFSIVKIMRELGYFPKSTIAESTLRRQQNHSATNGFAQDAADVCEPTSDEARHACVSSKVVEFLQPEQILQLVSLRLEEKGISRCRLLEICRRIGSLSVRTGDYRFRNQLYGGMDEYGLAASLMIEALNTSQYTYEVAPVLTQCERQVVQKLCQMVGWRPEEGEGMFSPGSSMANMYALVLARYQLQPLIKQQGVACLSRKLVVLTSQESHYSILKAANWLGIGTDQVVRVACDRSGRMEVASLQDQMDSILARGDQPLAVVATAGTTVQGAFDPIEKIATICKENNVWLHVDAAWGGAVLFSSKHRHLLAGLSQADSMCWNPHKMLGAPLQCSVLLVRQKGLLMECNSAGANYLFQKDKPYDSSYDTGDASVQCSRKADAFKLWLMWKARGSEGIGSLVDNAIHTAQTCATMIARRRGFRLINPDSDTEFANVCFWFVPESLRYQCEDERWWTILGNVAPRIKRHMMEQGSVMIGFQPLQHHCLPHFFRLVFTCHPILTTRQVENILDEIERLGGNLKVSDL